MRGDVKDCALGCGRTFYDDGCSLWCLECDEHFWNNYPGAPYGLGTRIWAARYADQTKLERKLDGAVITPGRDEGRKR